MIDKKHIHQLLEEKLKETEYFLLDCTVNAENKIVVTLDGYKDVTIEVCTDVNKYLEDKLDRERENFSLEVTTYGADQPLIDKRQYRKYLNRKVHVLTKEGNEYEGEMLELDNEHLTVEPMFKSSKKGMKPKKGKPVELEFEVIKEIKPVLKF